MNYISHYLPKNEYVSGAIEGALPHLSLLTPKTLFRFTKIPAFDLTDIAIRFYRNIPRRDISWLKWGTKSTLLTATAIRFINFCSPILRTTPSINIFMVFATLVSSLKSFSKCFPLLQNTQDLKGGEFTKKTISATFYAIYTISKLMTFYVGVLGLYSAINKDTDFQFETDFICYDMNHTMQCPSPTFFDITY